MEEKIISTQKIYEGRVVKLEVHEVTLPNGQTSKREVVRHPGAVAIVAIDENHQVLLVRQFRLPAGKVMLEIPAGTLELGEDPQECANRELQEETGFRSGKLESLGGIYPAPGYTSEYISLFLATDLSNSVLDMDEDEFIEVERVPFATALEYIENGMINDSKSVCGLLRVARRILL